jgi:hypothetical protein
MQQTSKSSPRPKNFRLQKSNIKTMLTTFFDKQGVIHTEGLTVNSAFYVEVIGRLLKRISRVRTVSSKGLLVLAARQCRFRFGTGSEDISGQTRCRGLKPPTLFS